VALECKYWKTIELPVEPGHEAQRGSVVFGQVVGVHIDDGILKDGRVDVLAFKPVARLGYRNTPRPKTSGACAAPTIRAISS